MPSPPPSLPLCRCVGGLEIAAMAGAYMEAARLGVVSLVDGYISAVAALCAARIDPACRRGMLFSCALVHFLESLCVCAPEFILKIYTHFVSVLQKVFSKVFIVCAPIFVLFVCAPEGILKVFLKVFSRVFVCESF